MAKSKTPDTQAMTTTTSGYVLTDPSANTKETVAELKESQRRELEANQLLNAVKIENVKEVAGLRASYDEKLRTSESARVDSNLRTSNESWDRGFSQLLERIQASDDRAVATADNLQKANEATKVTLAANTEKTVGEVTTRVAVIEKWMNEWAGKSAVTEPQQAMLIAKIDSLLDTRSIGSGERHGTQDNRSNITLWVAIAAVGLAFLIGIGSIAVTLYLGMNRTPVLPNPVQVQQATE